MTLVTFTQASTYGGTYVVAWGAIIFGGIQFYQGLTSGKCTELRLTDATRLLNVAAQLESSDPVRAIAVYTEIIRLFPNSSASAEAQRNLQAISSTKPN